MYAVFAKLPDILDAERTLARFELNARAQLFAHALVRHADHIHVCYLQ